MAKKGKKVEVEEKVASTTKTKVMACTCEHDFQDNHYGKGKRLYNRTGGPGGKGNAGWRCTVCGRQVV